MQHILFIGADFEQYLRLKTILNDFTCVYSVNLMDGVRQFNQQRFSLIVLDLSLILSDTGQEGFFRSVPLPHGLLHPGTWISDGRSTQPLMAGLVLFLG